MPAIKANSQIRTRERPLKRKIRPRDWFLDAYFREYATGVNANASKLKWHISSGYWLVMTEKLNSAQKAPADVALIVFGTDRRKKRHASRFGSETAARALEAARSMGMRTLPVVSDEQREIALKLPKGSISPKGRTVVPLVRPALYDKLLAVAGPSSDPGKSEQPQPNASEAKQAANAANAKPDATTGWSKLVKGSVVLAKESLDDMGWYESIVQSVDGEVLTLRWQAWPEYPKFNRKVTQVALLHPKMVKPC